MDCFGCWFHLIAKKILHQRAMKSLMNAVQFQPNVLISYKQKQFAIVDLKILKTINFLTTPT